MSFPDYIGFHSVQSNLRTTNFRISIRSLEPRLNQNLPKESSKYDFLRNLSNSDPKKQEIKKTKFLALTAPLVAELDVPQGDLFSSVIATHTPLNLTLEITDLPTGQLAEAHPFDLMNTTLKPEVCKLPSLLNLQTLNALRIVLLAI